MSPSLGMVVLVVEEMGRSLAFYRRLGLEVPEGDDDRSNVAVPMPGGLTFLLSTTFVAADDPTREAPAGGYRVLLEFFVDGREAVDAKYRELTAHGYRGHRAPFVASFGAYMAMVDDPDENTILITAG